MQMPAVVLVQHLHPGAGPGPAPGLPVLGTAAAYAAVLVAGLLAAPVLSRVAGRRVPRLAAVTVVATAYAVLLAAMLARHEVGAVVAVVGVAAAAGGVAAAFRGADADQLGSAAGILGVQTWLVASGEGAGHVVVVALHLVAAAGWLGGVIHLAAFATSGPERWQLAAGIRRFSRWAVGSAAVLAGTGVALVVIHHVGWRGLTHSSFGALVITKAALLVVAATLGLAHRRGLTAAQLRRRPAVLRSEAGVLAGALGAAVVLGGVALPLPVVEIAGPGLATVDLGQGQQATVFAVRRAGQAVVEVASDESLLVVDRVTGRRHQLAPGGLTLAGLAGNRAELALTSGTSTVNVSVPVAAAAPVPAGDAATADLSGWLDYQLGRAVAGPDTAGRPAPCAALTPAAEGVAMAAALRRFHVDDVQLIAGSSMRGQEFRRGLQSGGIRLGRSGTVLLATDPAHAAAALQHLVVGARPHGTPLTAVYLAPWLLDGRVLAVLPTLRLPPVLVASPIDPMSPFADGYRTVLALRAGGVPPSMAGLLGYAAQQSGALVTGLRLYTASPIGFLPGVIDAGHQHGDDGWFADGTLVSASAPTSAASCAVAGLPT